MSTNLTERLDHQSRMELDWGGLIRDELPDLQILRIQQMTNRWKYEIRDIYVCDFVLVIAVASKKKTTRWKKRHDCVEQPRLGTKKSTLILYFIDI